MATYNWKATYTDGTVLAQTEQDSYESIDKTKLLYFSLYDDSYKPVLDIIFDGDGEKLVWTRRTRMTLGEDPQVFHIVGKKGEFISALCEDGRVITRHNFVDDGLFYEVVQ